MPWQISNGNAWFCEVLLTFWLIFLILRVQFDKNNQAKVSAPIEGTNGVYYVKVNQIGALPNAMSNTDQQRKALETQLRQYATFSTMEALRKAADVKDTRRDAGY